MEPPILSQYSENPVYEIGAMINLVRVRPQTLWFWSQSLGISGDPRHDPSGQRRRYSERDLVALLWMREMVVSGQAPQDAAVILLNAQRGIRSGAGGSGGDYGASGPLVSGALPSGALNFDPPAWGQGVSGLLGPAPEDPWTAGQYTGASNYPSLGQGVSGRTSSDGIGGATAMPMQPGQSAPNEPWRAERAWNSGSMNTAGEMRATSLTGSLRPDTPTASQPVQPGGQSGRLGAAYGATLEPPTYSGRSAVASQSLASLRELRPMAPQLLQAFARFDTARANAIMFEALSRQGVDNVCVGLVQPAVARISELWSKSELTNPEERFALNYLRGFMYRLFQSTQEPMGAPFVVVGCAPNETSDFGALLLAVLWRRAGLRIAYLGRGIDGDQLLQGHWPVMPAVFALTATTSQRIRALARIGKKINELPTPQPLFTYWGPIFVRNPDLKRKVNGYYLGDDATTATQCVRRLLNMDTYSE